MTLEEAINFKQPVIELDWAKNKKSSYKGITDKVKAAFSSGKNVYEVMSGARKIA